MKEQRSISVPGINLEDNHHEEIEAAACIEGSNEVNITKQQQHQTLVRPTLFEVFIALKEREK